MSLNFAPSLACLPDSDALFYLFNADNIQKVFLWCVEPTVSRDAIVQFIVARTRGNEEPTSIAEVVPNVVILEPKKAYPYLGWSCLD